MFSKLPSETAERGKTFVLTATIAAFFLSTLVSFIFIGREGLLPMLTIIVPSVLAACGLAYLFWRGMMKKRESKKRGAFAGMLTGLCALPFALSPFTFFDAVTSGSSSISTSLYEALVISMLMTVYAFIFGGFFAPIMGGIAGAAIAKNVASEDDIQDAFN